MAVDWEQRVDFDRLRCYRLGRAKVALEASDLGALLLFDPNNLRYVTSTAIGTWERDKNIRFALLPRGEDPILWDFGSAARHHKLYCPWLPEENWRAWVPPMRGAMPDPTGVPDASPSWSSASCGSGASRGAARHRRPRHDDAARAAARRHPRGRLPAGHARGAQAEVARTSWRCSTRRPGSSTPSTRRSTGRSARGSPRTRSSRRR